MNKTTSEKLIPKLIYNIINKPLPIYGKLILENGYMLKIIANLIKIFKN